MIRFVLTAVIAVGLAATAQAQQTRVVPRIGVLSAALPRSAPMAVAFEARLRELGYVDGRDIVIEYRNAEGQREALARHAVQLLALNPAVIIAPGPEATLQVFHDHATTIPIVIVANDYDPLDRGYVSSYSRPNGNITGVTVRRGDVNAKRFELLAEMLPDVRSVTVLVDQFSDDLLPSAAAAAQKLGLTIKVLRLADPPYDFRAAFASVGGAGGAAITLASPIFFSQRQDLFAAAALHRIPVFYGVTIGVAEGALMGYGASFPAAYARAADYVDKILRGAKPGELPIEQLDKFDLVVNLKVARALQIAVPPAILARADEVIE